MPIFSKKRPFSQKHCALMSIKKNMKNPLLSCPYLIKKRQFCQNNTILWAKEVSMMPFFSDFSRKNHRSYAHILWKNVHSLKNTLLSSLYFVKKTSILSKTLCSHVKFFMKNSMLPCPYLVRKIINSVKAPLHYWAESQQDALFSNFSRKTKCSHAHM